MFWIVAEQTAIAQFSVHHEQTGSVITDRILRVLKVLCCDYFIWCVSCTEVVLTGFVMCGCFDNCVGVLVICVLVVTVFCTCSYCVLYCLYCVLYCFGYVYLFLFVLSVLV